MSEDDSELSNSGSSGSTNNNSGTSTRNNSAPTTLRPTGITDIMQALSAQVQQQNASQLSGAQLSGMNPKSDSLILTDSLTTISSLPSGETSTVKVTSYYGGTQITGYTVNVYKQVGSTVILVGSGTTPYTFSGIVGTIYWVEPNDFAPYYFQHWDDTQSAARYREAPIQSSPYTLQADYSFSNSGGGGGGGGPSGTGVVVPQYNPPGDATWSALLTACQDYPTVPFLIIINPDNGPINCAYVGTAPDASSYKTQMASFPTNATFAGYVDTGSLNGDGCGPGVGSASGISTLEQVAAVYSQFGTRLTWIFFDVYDGGIPQSTLSNASTQLATYVHSQGWKMMTNPGTTSVASGTGVDVWNVYENGGAATPSASSLTSGSGLSASACSAISYGFSSYSSAASQWVSQLQTAGFAWVNVGAAAGGSNGPYATTESVEWVGNTAATLASG